MESLHYRPFYSNFNKQESNQELSRLHLSWPDIAKFCVNICVKQYKLSAQKNRYSKISSETIAKNHVYNYCVVCFISNILCIYLFVM